MNATLGKPHVTTKPWVLIATGACALFALVLGIRHLGGSGSEPAVSTHEALTRPGASTHGRDAAAPADALAPPSERSGWIARPQSAGGSAASGGARGQSATGRTSGAADVTGPGHNSGPTIMQDGRPAGSYVGRGTGAADYASDDQLHIDSSLPAQALPFQGTRPLANGGAPMPPGATGGQAVAPAGTGTTAAPAADAQNTVPEDGGPVLSIPFDNSPDPVRGDTKPVEDKGVSYNSEGATFSTDAQMVIPDAGNISGEAGSISFNLKPDWGGGDTTDASLVQLREPNQWDNRLQIFKNGDYLRFILTDNTGIETDPAFRIDNWQPGDTHQITATWGRDENGAGVVNLFVDGQLAAQKNVDGQLQINPGTPLFVGSDYAGGQTGARGTISNLEIFHQALPADQIAAKVGH